MNSPQESCKQSVLNCTWTHLKKNKIIWLIFKVKYFKLKYQHKEREFLNTCRLVLQHSGLVPVLLSVNWNMISQMKTLIIFCVLYINKITLQHLMESWAVHRVGGRVLDVTDKRVQKDREEAQSLLWCPARQCKTACESWEVQGVASMGVNSSWAWSPFKSHRGIPHWCKQKMHKNAKTASTMHSSRTCVH